VGLIQADSKIVCSRLRRGRLKWKYRGWMSS
jgi:hypothetical protein